MTAKHPVAELQLRSPKGATVLDWPLEAGCADELIRKVESRRRLRLRRRKAAAGGAAAAVAALCLGAWAVPYLRFTSTLRTAAAQRRSVILPDGSRVELNARTEMRTDFRGGQRSVTMSRGEAFFSVAQDPRRPFTIETPDGSVRVTGTQFDVRLTPDSRTEVTLVEGSVVMQKDGRDLARLAPGQTFDSAGSAVTSLSPEQVEAAEAWRAGRLDCDGRTLAEAAARLAEYHGVKISVSPAVADLKLGGSLPMDNLPTALKALESALGVKAVGRGDGTYLLAGR
jgi:transmembrane sensor